MKLQKMRLLKGWSQEQLADISGLSTRTIQRVENGHAASVETLKALGAAFNIDFNALKETDMDTTANQTYSPDEIFAFKHVKRLRGFYTHAMIFASVITGLILLAYGRAFYLNVPVRHSMYIYTLFGWGLGLTIHGAATFGKMKIFTAEWEKREVEKYLGRKL
jgi:transcriptional regulator with XRE-family HTH domain